MDINTPVESTLNITYPKFSCAASDIAPFFCDYVTKVIRRTRRSRAKGDNLLYKGGLKIVTTLDVAMQSGGERAPCNAGCPPMTLRDLKMRSWRWTSRLETSSRWRRTVPSTPRRRSRNTTAINYSVDRSSVAPAASRPVRRSSRSFLRSGSTRATRSARSLPGSRANGPANSWRGSCPEAGGFPKYGVQELACVGERADVGAQGDRAVGEHRVCGDGEPA